MLKKFEMLKQDTKIIPNANSEVCHDKIHLIREPFLLEQER